MPLVRRRSARAQSTTLLRSAFSERPSGPILGVEVTCAGRVQCGMWHSREPILVGFLMTVASEPSTAPRTPRVPLPLGRHAVGGFRPQDHASESASCSCPLCPSCPARQKTARGPPTRKNAILLTKTSPSGATASARISLLNRTLCRPRTGFGHRADLSRTPDRPLLSGALARGVRPHRLDAGRSRDRAVRRSVAHNRQRGGGQDRGGFAGRRGLARPYRASARTRRPRHPGRCPRCYAQVQPTLRPFTGVSAAGGIRPGIHAGSAEDER
jgi:hypothetical protein